MNRYLVDSSIFISILRKKEAIISCYTQLPGEITTSSICLAELYEGVYKSKQPVENKADLETLLQTVHYVFPFSETEAARFGMLKAVMKQFLIPDTDLQIAATCIVHGIQIVTLDMNHFPRVPGLMIYEIS